MLWLWFQVALGCGGMFGPEEATVFSARQQAIFERHEDHVTVDYLVDTSGELEDFGWVIPIRGGFLSLEERDPAIFDELRELTTPQPVYHQAPASGGGGCSGAAKGGTDRALEGGLTNGVTVVAEGTTGLFDYVALEAESTTALVVWLDDHGWVTGENYRALDAYVAEGGWQFVAIAAAADSAPGPGGAVQSAVTLAYDGQFMTFPARMSMDSQAESQSTTLYVIGDERSTMTGWAVTPLPDVDRVGSDYVLAEELAALSADEGTYAEIWADEWEGRWLTRFDTVADSTQHEQDVALNHLGGVIPFRPVIDLYESEEAREGASGGCAVGRAGVTSGAWLLAVLGLRRRRKN